MVSSRNEERKWRIRVSCAPNKNIGTFNRGILGICWKLMSNACYHVTKYLNDIPEIISAGKLQATNSKSEYKVTNKHSNRFNFKEIWKNKNRGILYFFLFSYLCVCVFMCVCDGYKDRHTTSIHQSLNLFSGSLFHWPYQSRVAYNTRKF